VVVASGGGNLKLLNRLKNLVFLTVKKIYYQKTGIDPAIINTNEGSSSQLTDRFPVKIVLSLFHSIRTPKRTAKKLYGVFPIKQTVHS
jgi:hypothetical protein